LKILEAIAQFDREKPFDMLLVGSYSASIYTMSTNGYSDAEMTNYFDAVEVILSPDSGNVGWFVDSQRIRYWPLSLLARFADSILRVAETYALTYDALAILAQPPIGEGLYTWMVRCGYMNSGPSLDTSDAWKNYGQTALMYTNYLRRLKAQNFNYERYIDVDAYLEFHLPASNPPLHWFRSAIASNVAPVTALVDLRGLMDQKPDNDLFHAVVLDQIVKHGGNADPFDDIVKYVGFRSPIAGTHWRLYRGAVELGTNTTYSTDQQWLDALPVAVASNDHVRIGGILHVLAGRAVEAARIPAADFLIHDNDFVTIAALDVYRAVGSESDLVMLFNQFMTNVSTTVEGEITFADDFKIHAYWDAIQAIVEHHRPISAATANAIAAAFNTRTSSGVNMQGIATVGTPKAEPMSVLSPVGSSVDKVYAKYVTGPIGILGLFPGTDCDQALLNIQGLAEERYWDRGHKYASGEASMLQHTISSIVAAEVAGGTNRWSHRAARLHLMSELLIDQVAVSNQLEVLKDFRYEGLPVQEGGSWVFKDFQYQLNRRRGLEETRGVHFFYIK
jgi:hypothetical protein